MGPNRDGFFISGIAGTNIECPGDLLLLRIPRVLRKIGIGNDL